MSKIDYSYTDGIFKTSLAKENWETKYRYDNETQLGTQIRIAKALASVEKNPERWEEKFLRTLVKFDENGRAIGLKATCGGRITANIGTSYKGTTLLNCFINGPPTNASIEYERKTPNGLVTIPVKMKTSDSPDSLSNIMLALLEQAETLKSEGGYGIDFSWIRPRGSIIKGVGIEHPGVIHYMTIWDRVAEVIVAGNSDGYKATLKDYGIRNKSVSAKMKKMARKGAQMASLRIDHPDIEEFITAKQKSGALTKFNMSVVITDEFMNAVKNDDMFDLRFNGTVYKTVKATELYELIMKSTYNRNEPGVLFYDNMQSNNPLAYLSEVNTTNPCVAGDNWIFTKDGPRQVLKLKENKFKTIVNGKEYDSTPFWSSGVKSVYLLQTKEGYSLKLTNDHKLVKRKYLSRYTNEDTKTKACDFTVGDYIVLSNQNNVSWTGNGTYDEGWLVGEIVGDGGYNPDKYAAYLRFWGRTSSAMIKKASEIITQIDEEHTKTYPFLGVEKTEKPDNKRKIQSKLLDTICEKYILPETKDLKPEIEETSSDFYRGFISGFFDADGTVQTSEKGIDKGVSIRLSQSNLDKLYVVQRMLARLGIISTVFKNRRVEQERMMPDGKGGEQLYNCLANHEVSIAKQNMIKFRDVIGFNDPEKMEKLNTVISSYKRKPKKEDFVATFESLTYIGEEEVFDCTVDDVHVFDCNGIVTSNCGEVVGSPYMTTVCLLGSLNLPAYVRNDRTFDFDSYTEDVQTFARMLDNVNDLSGAALPAYEWAIKNIRQYGMGINGLGSCLYMMGIKYDSKEGFDFAEKISYLKEEYTWKTSALLAKEKGPFTAFSGGFLTTNWFTNFTKIPDYVKTLIKENGVRNGKTSTNPPLGNSSIICDLVSNGIEPIFCHEYFRTRILDKWPEGLNIDNAKTVLKKVKIGNSILWEGDYNGNYYVYEPHNRGLCIKEPVRDYGYNWVLENYPNDISDKNDYLVTAGSISVYDHVEMQAVHQKHINQSISKTCNINSDYPYEDFKDLYFKAWEKGLIGFTTYRDGTMESVLSKVEKREIITKDLKLPNKFINGPMEVIKKEGIKFYMHFSYHPDDQNMKFPIAFWLHTNNMEGEIKQHNPAVKVLFQLLEDNKIDKDLLDLQREKMKEDSGYRRVSKMISMCLRHNIPIEDIVNALHKLEDVFVVDTIYAVRKFLMGHVSDGTEVKGMSCPECKSESLEYSGGCVKCLDCGWSGCN